MAYSNNAPSWLQNGQMNGLQPVEGNPGLFFDPSSQRYVYPDQVGTIQNGEYTVNQTPIGYAQFDQGALRSNRGGYDYYGDDGSVRRGQLTPEKGNKFGLTALAALGGLGALAGGGLLGSAAGAGEGAGALSKAALDGTTIFGANSVPGALSLGGAALPAAAGAAPAGGGLLSGLTGSLPGGLGSLGGLASTALGGLLGSKGQQSSQSTTRDIPTWLQPYVNENLGFSSGLLRQQMSPQFQQGFINQQNVGQGLLSQPVAGNGFTQFANRRLM